MENNSLLPGNNNSAGGKLLPNAISFIPTAQWEWKKEINPRNLSSFLRKWSVPVHAQRKQSWKRSAWLGDCPGLAQLYSPAPGSGAPKACREGARAFSHWYFQGSVWLVARGQVHEGVVLSALALGSLWQVWEHWASLKHALVWCEVAVPAPVRPCTDPVAVILKPRPAEQVGEAQHRPASSSRSAGLWERKRWNVLWAVPSVSPVFLQD